MLNKGALMGLSNTKIYIPDEIYVAAKYFEKSIPTGRFLPNATGQVAEAKKSRLKRGQDFTNVVKNESLIGFKIAASAYNDFREDSAIQWSVQDPRGFKIIVSSGNLKEIMTYCHVHEGEILEPCIWGQLNSANILLPVSSLLYEYAVTNTERMRKHASVRDVVLGDNVITLSGVHGVYLGNQFLITLMSRGSPQRAVTFSPTKRHIVGVARDDGEPGYKHLHYDSAFRLSEIIKAKDPMGTMACVSTVHEHLLNTQPLGNIRGAIVGSTFTPRLLVDEPPVCTLVELHQIRGAENIIIEHDGAHYYGRGDRILSATGYVYHLRTVRNFGAFTTQGYVDTEWSNDRLHAKDLPQCKFYRPTKRIVTYEGVEIILN
jgi:hypothetical protein